MSDIRLDGIDHMPNWMEKRSAVGSASMTRPMFPVVNAILDFVSLKIETVSKVILDIRRMLRMFEIKPTLFKVGNRNTRTRCETC